MVRPLRRTGRVRSLMRALLSIPWAYAWMVPLVIALRIDPAKATVVLLGTIAIFVALYVVRPLRLQPRMVAHLRLRPCRRYLSWLTLAVALKLLLILSSLVLHEQLATWRILPRLPDDPEFVSAAFLAHPFGPLALFLAIAVMAPLIEEFAFRGWMQHELEHTLGLVPAIVFTGALFSLLHGRIDAIHHLAFGLFAGWVVWRTGSIWAAVYMHALNNAGVQLMMHVTPDSFMSWSQIPSWLWPYAIAVGVLALGGFIGTGARIHRMAQIARPRARAWSHKRSLGPAVTPVL
jgi:membrane protease YdiL (CAAX protease family)